MRTPSERRRPSIRLTVSSARSGLTQAAAERVLSLPPVAAGALAGATAAASGWVLVTAFCLIAWFTATAMPIPTVLGFASSFWLTAHGAGAVVGGQPITVIPLGLTLFLVWLVRLLTGIAQRQARVNDEVGHDTVDPRPGWAPRVKLVLGVAAGYAAVSAVISLGAGLAPRLWLAALGGAVVALLGAAWALSGELAGQQARGLPEWVRFLPGALGSGLLAMAGFSAVALAIGVIAGWDKISRLITALELDGVGAFLVGVLHLLYLPNFLVWSASFLSGAGFSVGLGSVVAPMGTSTGILPAIPILGALPAPGPGGPAAFLWLIAGLLMGSVAGARMVRRLPQPPTLLVSLGLGALAGVLT
ncbi:MAG: DUF6350 family protein, partial [Micropruina sp.]